MVVQDGHQISLARLSLPGTRDAFKSTVVSRGQHDQDYEAATSLRDKWKANRKMIKTIDLPGDKTWTESIVRRIMQAKLCLKL